MRRISIVLIVVCVTSTANAGLMFGVGGAEAPDCVMFSDVFQILGEEPVPVNASVYVAGFGDVTFTNASLAYGGSLSSVMLLEDYIITFVYFDRDTLLSELESYGLIGINDIIAVTLADGSGTPAPLTGLLVDEITLGEGLGEVFLLDESLNPIDNLNFCIPEPISIIFWGFSGLFLYRRR